MVGLFGYNFIFFFYCWNFYLMVEFGGEGDVEFEESLLRFFVFYFLVFSRFVLVFGCICIKFEVFLEI